MNRPGENGNSAILVLAIGEHQMSRVESSSSTSSASLRTLVVSSRRCVAPATAPSAPARR